MSILLQLIGWGFFVIIGIYMIIIWFFMIMNNCGQYNIGGVPNSGLKMFLTLLVIIPIGYYWKFVISIMPFTINFIHL